jgi:2,3-bisphosphoglycerate-dependent phosphoglycerate mutase
VTAFAQDRFILIRHAMPNVDADVPPHRWQLGVEGRAAAASLREALPDNAYLVASDEPKAVETIREIAGHRDIPMDQGFAEVRRRKFWKTDEEYRDLARSYLEGVEHPAWEAHQAVVDRFDAALTRNAARAADAGRALVVGTHGMAMTLWLASRKLIEPANTAFWEALGFPDLIDVDIAAGRAAVRTG